MQDEGAKSDQPRRIRARRSPAIEARSWSSDRGSRPYLRGPAALFGTRSSAGRADQRTPAP